MYSGSGVHLLWLCTCLANCNYDIRIVLAPVTSFGRIPFCRPDPVLAARGITVQWPGTIKIGSVYIPIRAAVWRKALGRIGVYLVNALSRLAGSARRVFPSDLGKCLDQAEARDLLDAVNAIKSDLVISEYSSLAVLLGRCQTERRAVLLHDLFSSRSQSFQSAGLQPDHFDLSPGAECNRLRDADLCIHSSYVEAKLLEERLPDVRHIWMRPIILSSQSEGEGPPRAVFIGSDHAGNREALNLILGEIWPTVQPCVPHELWIVGEISKWVRGRPPGVRCIRFLKDLHSMGTGNSIGIAPMRAASGISIKISTYLELGMRVLAFRQTVEAYDDTLDDLVVTVDTPTEFAAALTQMLLHPEHPQNLSEESLMALQTRLKNRELLDWLDNNGEAR